MATVLRTWSYQYQWLYDGVSRLGALSVGREVRFHQFPLQGLTISSESKIFYAVKLESQACVVLGDRICTTLRWAYSGCLKRMEYSFRLFR